MNILKVLLIACVFTLSACTQTQVANQEETSPKYGDYTEARYNALLGQKPFTIFFHASWCPTCQMLDKGIRGTLDTFPEKTIILKANYDKELGLRKKYGITYQSTFALINKDGNHLKTLTTPSEEKLKEEIITLTKLD